MKKASKIALGTAALVAVSAGVSGVTTYSLMQSKQDKNTSFNEAFDTADNMSYAALDASSMQPVDLTKAAESSLSSVVRITAVQHSKVQTIQQQPDIFDFFFGDGRGVNSRCRLRNREVWVQESSSRKTVMWLPTTMWWTVPTS